MKIPLNYLTLKKYRFKKPVDIAILTKLLKENNNIKNIEIYDKSVWLKYNMINFLLILNNENKLLWIKRKINLSKSLISFVIPIIVLIIKIAIENYLSDTWNTIVSIIVSVFVITWIIYKFGFPKNKNDKLFIKLFEEKILK